MSCRRAPLVVVLALSIGSLAGCTEAEEPTWHAPTAASAPASAAAQPADVDPALTAAVQTLDEGDYAYVVEHGGGRTEGILHRPSGSGKTVRKPRSAATPGETVVQIGTDVYVRRTGAKWEHYDENDRRPFEVVEGDRTGAAGLIGAVAASTGAAPAVTGTIDATKLGEDNVIWLPEDIAAMGEAARAITFRATLDGRGRLTKLEVDVPRSGPAAAHTMRITFSGYGAQKPVPKPTGEIVDADTD